LQEFFDAAFLAADFRCVTPNFTTAFLLRTSIFKPSINHTLNPFISKATSLCTRKATIHPGTRLPIPSPFCDTLHPQARVLTIPRSAGSGRATLEFSTEEFAADALKLNGITLISFEVRQRALDDDVMSVFA
jgi:hypothetical protein